jgi:hypothetical protein
MPKTRPTFYFENNPARYLTCGICGAVGFPGDTVHESAVHEVYFFVTYGTEAVCFPARPHVAAWADGSAPLPSRADYAALTAAFYGLPA